MIYYTRIKEKEIQNCSDLLQTKNQNKTYLKSYLNLLFILALLIFEPAKQKQQRPKEVLFWLKCRLCLRHNQFNLGSIFELRNLL